MRHQGKAGARVLAQRIAIMAAVAGLAAGCGDRQSPDRAQVEIRGSDPAGGSAQAAAPRAGAVQPAVPGGSVTGSGDIVRYDGYEAARARQGDTVTSLAQRIGLSASELGAYNGLSPTNALREGDELVLPPRPGGYGTALAAAPAQSPQPAAQNAAPGTRIEAMPLDPGAGSAAGGADLDAQSTQAPPTSPVPNASGWSPDLALAAIDRSQGGSQGTPPPAETPGTSVTLPAPPSADAPLPANPVRARDLASPDLSQYQSPPETAGGQDLVFAPDAVPETAPALPQGARLLRPVDGPVALGYREGAGGTRNDGVDFAAAAGAPVLAAESGEVVLVSEALGGLGTIVLVRHPGELLTVYGRITGVTVKKGDIVQRGQPIGVVARGDTPGEPRMHFEVREGANSVDPMLYL